MVVVELDKAVVFSVLVLDVEEEDEAGEEDDIESEVMVVDDVAADDTAVEDAAVDETTVDTAVEGLAEAEPVPVSLNCLL